MMLVLLLLALVPCAMGANATTTTTTLAPTTHMTGNHSGTHPPPIDVGKLPILAWIIVAAVLVAILVFNTSVVRYYTDRHETELLPFVVTVLSLSITMFAVLLVPVDIYLADAGVHCVTDCATSAIAFCYYILYGVIMLFTFVIVPFSYFYYEEDDEDVTAKERAVGACKYTSFLIVIMIILFITGALLQGGHPPMTTKLMPTDPKNVEKWLKAIFDGNPGEFAVTFGISCLTVLGYLCVGTYTAYGLAAMPIDMMRGRKSKDEEQADIYSNLNMTKEKKRAINAKYLSGKKMSKRDEKTLSLLSRKERVLSRQGERIEDTQKGCGRLVAILRPFAFVFGAIFFLFSMAIFISLAMTQIVKILGNSCGTKCGFFLKQPWSHQPIDFILSNLAHTKAFLDLIMFALIIVYLYMVTLSGVVKVGIRILWMTLFKLRKRSSPPQGLMLASVILVLGLLAINNMLLTLAPQYTSYGSQSWFNATATARVPCSINAPQGQCFMSEIAKLQAKITLSMPFFGIAYYFGTWLFLGSALLCCFIAIVRCSRSNVDGNESDSDEDEF